MIPKFKKGDVVYAKGEDQEMVVVSVDGELAKAAWIDDSGDHISQFKLAELKPSNELTDQEFLDQFLGDTFRLFGSESPLMRCIDAKASDTFGESVLTFEYWHDGQFKTKQMTAKCC